jgi:O-antigen/teichoic acid export membrane protein
MRLHFCCYPALGVLVVLRTALQAMGRRAVTVVSSSLELGMKILAAVWLIPTYGFIGTSVTEPVTWILCAVFLTAVYVRTREKLFDGRR